MVTRSRGQVILIGAVLVAVIFVSLAFVVNAAISTDTVSVQGIEDVRDDRALQIQQEVRNATREAYYSSDSDSEFDAKMTALNASLRAQYAHAGRFVGIASWSHSNPVTVTFIYYSPQTHYVAELEVDV